MKYRFVIGCFVVLVGCGSTQKKPTLDPDGTPPSSADPVRYEPVTPVDNNECDVGPDGKQIATPEGACIVKAESPPAPVLACMFR